MAGLSVGSLTHIVPMYIAEVGVAEDTDGRVGADQKLSPPNLRGSLVALQQLSITLGVS